MRSGPAMFLDVKSAAALLKLRLTVTADPVGIFSQELDTYKEGKQTESQS